MRSGLPRTEVISFEAGPPDGNLTYTIAGVTTGSVSPEPQSVSVNIQISPAYNTLSAGTLTGFRDLTWQYYSGGVAITGTRRWTLEGTIPFGATADGVRNKLGLDLESELPEDQVPLIKAYYKIQNLTGASTLAGLETGTAYQKMLIADAIEAAAAIILLPTMQVRLAKSETSGTNTYTRQTINWDKLETQLNAIIAEGVALAAPGTVKDFGSLFSVSTTLDLFPDG